MHTFNKKSRLKDIMAAIAILILMLPQRIYSQGFLRAEGKRIVNGRGENILLRGIGLGGWMLQEGYMLKVYQEGQQYRIRERMEAIIGKERTENFYKQWLSNHTSKADIDSLKAWGFNSVRLPMHFNLYTLPAEQEPVTGRDTWLEKGFQMTDSLLSWCKSNSMYLILDLHAAPGGQGNDLNISDRDPAKPSLWESETNRRKTVALWKKIAGRYANEPWIGAYDIVNEPNWGFTNPEKDRNGTAEPKNEPLKKLMMDITGAIRQVDKNHLIIIEGNGWGNNYNGVMPPWDKNMALSFHKYWNHNTPGSIKGMLEMRDKYNVPVWLGETGENSNVWYTQAIQLLEGSNIGWAWWPLKKIGINNPFEVRSNADYDALVNYWNNKGQRPSAESAYRGLMTLASSLKTERNVVHRDVIDAMMRQPSSIESRPFVKHVLLDSVRINAADYDLGRNGYAYFDRDTADYHVSTGTQGAGNRGGLYRNDGVDISPDPADSTTYCVTEAQAGEWLQYTIDVRKAGSCNISVRLMSTAPSTVSLWINGQKRGNQVTVPSTASQNVWRAAEMGQYEMAEGKNTIRIYIDNGTLSLKDIVIK
ncbi:cellulase family glycosylhydrolase [Arcticibacter sp. MXS-1]|uniref:cellulase family glycosylhydrolase n=1 Tax=Arcticibacter sp. MXS-1 TaxID=3341726 RepID=UPI0035A910BE